MAVQTEHVHFRPEYQASEETKTLEPTERQQLGHAFTETPSVFQLLSTVRSRRFGMGYRYETGESETLTWSQNRTVTTERGPLAYKSAQSPHPLGEVEEALAAWAARGPAGDREHEHLAVLGRADDPRALQRPGGGPCHRQRQGHVDVPPGRGAPRPCRDQQRGRPLEGARLVPGGQDQDLGP